MKLTIRIVFPLNKSFFIHFMILFELLIFCDSKKEAGDFLIKYEWLHNER